jgi:cell wall-associated NlpC family hydrolase
MSATFESGLDPRLNAFRPDLADIALKGKVSAKRFVPGQPLRVAAAQTSVRREPATSARLETEALHGERVKVFETTADGWVWAQLETDGYVGWILRADLAESGPEPTHRVSVPRTLVFAEPDIKSEVLAGLPLNAAVTAIDKASDRNAEYALIAPRGAIVTQHLLPLGEYQKDWVATAERLLGAPYLWGGKTLLGIDCSGLVQVALAGAGVRSPRDSDMQEKALGKPLSIASGLPPLRRGDLAFWKGHVGMMLDADRLLHANAHHMIVTIEPLAAAVERIRKALGPVTGIRRIS